MTKIYVLQLCGNVLDRYFGDSSKGPALCQEVVLKIWPNITKDTTEIVVEVRTSPARGFKMFKYTRPETDVSVPYVADSCRSYQILRATSRALEGLRIKKGDKFYVKVS